jgi:Flp pilus assembly protein TadG
MKVADMKQFNRQKGVAAVEFAIVAPLLFLLIFGIISYGIMLYNQALITNATRTGARAGIVFSVSGNGLQGYETYPSTCTTLTNNNIYGTTAAAIAALKADAQETALCAANNAIRSVGLIGFGPTTAIPTMTATTTGCAADTIGPSCLLTVSISYAYIGVYQLNGNLSARTAMYYE